MPHYNKAPITEALIDIKTELTPTLRFEDLQAIKRSLPDYPHEEVRNLGQGVLQFGPSVHATAQQRPYALVLRNSSNNQIVQVRLDGFTFSRLRPYEDWEHLRDEAKRVWDIYRELMHPKQITNVAVRYINQFDFAGDSIEPVEYLKTFPNVSEEIPSELRNFTFQMNLQMPQPDLNGMLTLGTGNTQPTAPGTIPIVLDLSLVVNSPPASNEQELWEFFEKLRTRKNLYFEACITNKTRELIS